MTVALEVEHLSFAFPGGTSALRDVSFRVAEGECVALLGPNGAGKSTLLLHLNGILPERGPRKGVVLVGGTLVESSTLPSVRRQVGLLFQEPDDQLFCPTIGEDVAFGPIQLGLSDLEVAHRVKRALEEVGLAGFERRQPHHLSGGEKKRACLAGLLACEPAILAFDEPTAGLDPRGRRQLIRLLERLSATKILATHDLPMVAELCSRVIVLDEGRVVADGPTRTVLLDDELMMAHGLERPRTDYGTTIVK
jgi:cobalt/nickel transport system ATP-binding protein